MDIDLRARAIEVLTQGHLMSLGVSDVGGVWVADVIYIFDDDLTLYWMSHPETRHSKAVVESGAAAGTITVSNKSKEPNFGLQFAGTASKIDGARFDLAVKFRAKRGYPPPQEDEDVLDGDSWYMLKPSLVELIDEANFGYTKQTVSLR